MATRTLKAQVAAIVLKCKRRTEFVIRASPQDLAVMAQTPGPSVARPDNSKGGLLPVNIAFLRSTFAAKVGSMPIGPREAGDVSNIADWQPPVALVLANLQIGDDLNMGWTAVYARPMEQRYGFMRAAADQWQTIVSKNVALARVEIK